MIYRFVIKKYINKGKKMFEFMYWDMTGSVPFDLAFSVIGFFAINGYIIKAIRGIIFSRSW